MMVRCFPHELNIPSTKKKWSCEGQKMFQKICWYLIRTKNKMQYSPHSSHQFIILHYSGASLEEAIQCPCTGYNTSLAHLCRACRIAVCVSSWRCCISSWCCCISSWHWRYLLSVVVTPFIFSITPFRDGMQRGTRTWSGFRTLYCFNFLMM